MEMKVVLGKRDHGASLMYLDGFEWGLRGEGGKMYLF